MKISYFDLLDMIQDEKAPKKIKVEVVRSTSKEYIAEYDSGEFSHYYLVGDEDENYKRYLSECFIESTMFDECITILDEEDEFEDIEFDESDYYDESPVIDDLINIIGSIIKNQKKIIERLNNE